MKTVQIILEAKVSEKVAKRIVKKGIVLDAEKAILEMGDYKFYPVKCFIKGD